MRLLKLIGIAVAVVALAAVVASCGSSDDDGSSSSSGKTGGTLKVLANGDVDSIDPGGAYFQFTYMVTYATQRPLFSWKPEDTTEPSPDLATEAAEVSSDGKTVSVTIRDDVKYSPPVDRVGDQRRRQVRGRARLQVERPERLRQHLLRRHRGLQGVPRRQRQRHLGHRDAERHRDRLQPHAGPERR